MKTCANCASYWTCNHDAFRWEYCNHWQPKLVLCKDCKHRDWRQSPEHGKVKTVCKHPGGLKNPRKDGFCGYGERKDDG